MKARNTTTRSSATSRLLLLLTRSLKEESLTMRAASENTKDDNLRIIYEKLSIKCAIFSSKLERLQTLARSNPFVCSEDRGTAIDAVSSNGVVSPAFRNEIGEGLAVDELAFLVETLFRCRRRVKRAHRIRDALGAPAPLRDTLDTYINAELESIDRHQDQLDVIRRQGRRMAISRAQVRARLRPLWEGWLRFSTRFGLVTNTIILSAVYFLFVTPIALLQGHSSRQDGVWSSPEETVSKELFTAKQQF